MRFLKSLIVTALTVAALCRIACAESPALILFNGTILTGEGLNGSTAQLVSAIAIAGDSVLAVGSDAAIRKLAGRDLYMLHDLKQLDLEPVAAGFAAVLSGHSHKPVIEWKRGVLYLNPGSCGPRRFQLPISCALLRIPEVGPLVAQILEF